MRVLTAVYDLDRGPVSYDFITWLVRAMQERDRRGCLKLHVVLLPKEDGLGGFSRHWGPHDEHAAQWRLWHIVIPACALAGATVTFAPGRKYAIRLTNCGECWAPADRVHLAGPIMESARQGTKVPQLASTQAARRYVSAWLADERRPVVTLTLRKQSNDTARNTDAQEWKQLAGWLEEIGYRVIVLDDTHEMLCRGEGYAALDIDLRLALYERAAMNVVGNNGPAALLWHSAAPYMRMAAGIPSDWGTNLGLKQGEQVPWATKNQVLVYAPATFQAMQGAFRTWAGATS